MNKALLAIVCAASMSSYAMAVTPVDMTVSITSGGTERETLENFNLKFLYNGSAAGDNGIIKENAQHMVYVEGAGTKVTAKTQLAMGLPGLLNVRLPEVIRVPGDYDVVVPEGAISCTIAGEEVCNKEVKIPVKIIGSTITMTQGDWMQYFVIDPADGSNLTKLGTFTLAGNTKLEFLPQAGDAILKDPYDKEYYSGADIIQDDTQAQYRFSADAGLKGAYVLTIPEGSLKTTLTGKGEVRNPELVFHYTVGQSSGSDKFPVDVDLAVSPLNTTTSAESFSSFFIKVTDGEDILGPFTIDYSLINKVSVSCATTAFKPSTVVNVEGDPSAIELRFDTPVTAGGVYSVTLPEGLLSWERFTNETLTLKDAFTCTGDVVDYFGKLSWKRGSAFSTSVAVPDNFELETIGGLFGVYENIPAGSKIEFPMEGVDEMAISTSKALVQFPDGKVEEKVINPAGTEGNAFRISVTSSASGLREEGEYTITIPAGSFKVDGMNNPEVKQVFTVVDRNVYTPVDLTYSCNPRPEIPQETLSYVSWVFDAYGDVNGKRQKIYTSRGVKPKSVATVTGPSGNSFEVPIVDYTLTTYDQLGFAIDLVPDIITNGKYTISVPEGAYRMVRESDGALFCNAAFSYEYTVKNNIRVAEPTITPAPGSVVPAMTKVELYRPTGYTMYLPLIQDPEDENSYIAAKTFTFTTPDGVKKEIRPTTNANVEGDYIFVYLDQTYTEPGEYSLVIPENGILLFNSDDVQVNFPEAEYKFTVKEYTPSNLAYSVEPQDDSNIYVMNFFYVTFEEPVKYTSGIQCTVKTADDKIEKLSTSFNTAKNRLMLTYMSVDITPYGEYVFTVPEGVVVTEDGRSNKEITFKYNYCEIKGEKVPFTVTPAEGMVEKLDKITLKAPEEFVSMLGQDSYNTRLPFVVDEEKPENLVIHQTESDPEVYVEVSSKIELKEDQVYDLTLTVPENTFTLTKKDGSVVYNYSSRYSWRMDKAGVAEFLGDGGKVTVYTIDGTCLYRNEDIDILSKLDKGIYIINGKKVSLR